MESSNTTTLGFTNLLVIFFTLLMGQVIFLVVCYVVVNTNESSISEETIDIFRVLTPLVVAVSIITGLSMNYFRLKTIRKVTDVHDKFKRFTANNIIGWACIEGASMMCIISFLVTHEMVYVYLAILVLAFFLFNMPTKSRIVSALQMDLEESSLLK